MDGRWCAAKVAESDVDDGETFGEIQLRLLIVAPHGIEGEERDPIHGDVEESIMNGENGGLGDVRAEEGPVEAIGGLGGGTGAGFIGEGWAGAVDTEEEPIFKAG